jgi:hypothetical protein
MKSHPSGRDSSVKGSSSQHSPSGRHEPARPREYKYDLRVSYYSRMNLQRVYSLVVEVPRGKGSVPADGPTGATVTLRPVVPGALVVPAQLPLEVARPGARATFHVTPLVRGRLPEACVRVLMDGQPARELRTRMKVKTQRLAWLLLLLALVLPAALVYWTYVAPLQGLVSDTRTIPDLGLKKDDKAEKELAKKFARSEVQPPIGQPGDRQGGPPQGMPGGPPGMGAGRGAPVPKADQDEGPTGENSGKLLFSTLRSR